jgi:3-phosphoshikimate 1-carboxyvinyltransferase
MPSPPTATIPQTRQIRGRLRVPGDKSIAHRYALLAALAQGPSSIAQFAPGADCRSTLACLAGLGVEIREADGAITLMGRGLRGFRSPAAPLDAGNSGTTMRMLAGILAAQPFSSVMIGDESLSRRPMRRVMAPLLDMGARIDAVDGHAPLTIHGAALRPLAFRATVPSAQVKSAVLFAGLHAEGETSVTEPAQTRDHTERAMRAFGIEVGISGLKASVRGGQQPTGCELAVPGDFSSAAFWLVAAASLPGSRVEIEDVGLNPTRTDLIAVLKRFGAHVDVHVTDIVADEPRGTIVVEGDRTGDLEIGPDEVPGLIDELPAIAALAAHSGSVTVSGASELRVKESDRIATLVAGFRALGIDADERADGFAIKGSGEPSGGTAHARGDHRMAMAFAVAALRTQRASRIEGSDSVGISYPGFFDTLERLVA